MFALWENLISCRNVFGDGEYELDVVGGEDPGQLSEGGVILEEKRDITLVQLQMNQCDVSLLLQDYPSIGQLSRVLTASLVLCFGNKTVMLSRDRRIWIFKCRYRHRFFFIRLSRYQFS